jgi:hypothetical protein
MRTLVCAFCVLMCAGTAHANNNFSATAPFGGTQIIGTSGNLVATTAGANGQTGEPGALPAGSTLNTMWYAWTAPASGAATFETCSNTQTVVDTVIAAYTGNAVNALVQLVQNDDTTGCATTSNANYGSRITFAATAGTTYHIQVDGYNNATGAFRLAWTAPIPAPSLSMNKTFVFATDLNNNGLADVGDVITYSFAVANTGNVLITGISVNDTHGGAAPLGPITPVTVPSLAPGANTLFQATYAVVQADVDNQ